MFMGFALFIFALSIVLFGKRDKSASRLYFDTITESEISAKKAQSSTPEPMTVSVGGTIINEKQIAKTKPEHATQRAESTVLNPDTIDMGIQEASGSGFDFDLFAEELSDIPTYKPQTASKEVDPLAAFKEAANKSDPNTMRAEAQDLFAKYSKKGSL